MVREIEKAKSIEAVAKKSKEIVQIVKELDLSHLHDLEERIKNLEKVLAGTEDLKTRVGKLEDIGDLTNLKEKLAGLEDLKRRVEKLEDSGNLSDLKERLEGVEEQLQLLQTLVYTVGEEGAGDELDEADTQQESPPPPPLLPQPPQTENNNVIDEDLLRRQIELEEKLYKQTTELKATGQRIKGLGQDMNRQLSNFRNKIDSVDKELKNLLSRIESSLNSAKMSGVSIDEDLVSIHKLLFPLCLVLLFLSSFLAISPVFSFQDAMDMSGYVSSIAVDSTQGEVDSGGDSLASLAGKPGGSGARGSASAREHSGSAATAARATSHATAAVSARSSSSKTPGGGGGGGGALSGRGSRTSPDSAFFMDEVDDLSLARSSPQQESFYLLQVLLAPYHQQPLLHLLAQSCSS